MYETFPVMCVHSFRSQDAAVFPVELVEESEGKEKVLNSRRRLQRLFDDQVYMGQGMRLYKTLVVFRGAVRHVLERILAVNKAAARGVAVDLSS